MKLRPAAWILASAVTGASAYWAVSRVVGVESDVTLPAEPVTVVASEMTIGRSIERFASLTADSSILARFSTSGTITSVRVEPGSIVELGSPILEVDYRIVSILAGQRPSIRTMEAGIVGPDVAQLQSFLIDAGYLSAITEPDGQFGSATTRAVKRWQEAIGQPVPDGVVEFGDVVFTPEISDSSVVSPKLQVGQSVEVGVPLLVDARPTVSISLSLAESQAEPLLLGTEVVLSLNGESLGGVVDEITTTLGGRFASISLQPAVDPCAFVDCNTASETNPLAVPTTIVVEPEISGVGIPQSALTEDDSGNIGVRTDSGDFMTVVVVGQDRGIAIVEGIAAGTTLRVGS